MVFGKRKSIEFPSLSNNHLSSKTHVVFFLWFPHSNNSGWGGEYPQNYHFLDGTKGPKDFSTYNQETASAAICRTPSTTISVRFYSRGILVFEIMNLMLYLHISMFENYSKCRIWIFSIVCSISHRFCPLKIDLLLDRNLQVFKNSPNGPCLAF